MPKKNLPFSTFSIGKKVCKITLTSSDGFEVAILPENRSTMNYRWPWENLATPAFEKFSQTRRSKKKKAATSGGMVESREAFAT